MASPFRIPRKKGPPDSVPLPRLSPLSRLQSPAPQPQGYGRLLGPGTRAPAEGPGGPNVGMLSRERHKRASDGKPGDGSQPATTPPKKKCGDRTGETDNVLKSASWVELRGAKHAGTASSFKATQTTFKSGAGSSSEKKASSKDDFKSPPRNLCRAAFSVGKAMGEGRRSLTPTCSGGGGGGLMLEDVRERQRAKWLAFKEKNKPSLGIVEPTRSNTIVLSSEDEEPKTSSANHSRATGRKLPELAFLHLDFRTLHLGLRDVGANGPLKITETGIHIPLRGGADGEEAEVTVVASQLRGYGLWDGGVAEGGTLLAGWEGPAPSLLFLWVTEAQANLLQRELLHVCWAAPTCPPCNFLLLVLRQQLPELQAAQLASILDMAAYRQGRAAAVASPLALTRSLLLQHACPRPVAQIFLKLLGYVKCSPKKRPALQELPTRLIQYPRAPFKGRITVTQEDLVCLNHGQLLNDVIIDFYLKYLLLEGVGGEVAGRTHVFSSFFFKHLSRRRAASDDSAPSVPDRYVRHKRVKTWTRHLDIFLKDFLIIPINENDHWFLVMVCYPGLEEEGYEDFTCTGKPADQSSGRSFSRLLLQKPTCTKEGWTKDKVLKRPCILVMDSLTLSRHDNVCRLIRDYLQVEWEARRRTPRLFSEDAVQSCNCKVLQQDNSTDCGIYLLQYAHSFLQNPVVHFELPLQLDGWFPRQQVRQKREEIRRLILRLRDEA